MHPLPTGCWLWTGRLHRNGYGAFWDGKRLALAHRVAHELFVGPIPAGLTIDHLCRNPSCVNPTHLEPVTQRVNDLRGNTMAAMRARVTACPQGHPYSDANTSRDSKGRRYCKTCHRDRARAKYRRQHPGCGRVVP